MWRQAASAGVYGLLAVWVVGIGSLCWVVRDGLGPGSVGSSGWVAVGRFLMTFAWGPVAVVLGAAGWGLGRSGPRAGGGAVDAG